MSKALIDPTVHTQTTQSETIKTKAVHTWFELSYANYLVLPRPLMQSMPDEWQHRMVTCLEELHDAFAHVPQAEGYEVIAGEVLTLMDLSDGQLRHLGYSRVDPADDDLDGDTFYYDRDGNEVSHPDCYRVVWPSGDPVPHYDRGRTYIEPRFPKGYVHS